MKKHLSYVFITGVVGAIFPFAVAFSHTEASPGEITHMQEMALSNALLAKVQSGDRACASLSADDFTLLGEHFMEAALGDTHEQIETKFETVLSHNGIDDMHLLLGKYGVHCDAATFGALATNPSGGSSTPALGVRDLAAKGLLWLFALYGVFSLVQRLTAKKV